MDISKELVFEREAAILLLSVADEILTIPIRVSLSQVRRLNDAVAICRRCRLISVYT